MVGPTRDRDECNSPPQWAGVGGPETLMDLEFCIIIKMEPSTIKAKNVKLDILY